MEIFPSVWEAEFWGKVEGLQPVALVAIEVLGSSPAYCNGRSVSGGWGKLVSSKQMSV